MARAAQRQAERPRERSPSAHPLGMSAAVYSPRALPEDAPAVGASASDGCNLLYIEVYHGLVRRSSLGGIGLLQYLQAPGLSSGKVLT